MRKALSVTGAAAVLCLTAFLHAATDPASVVEAARDGDLPAMRALLKTGADVNTAQGDGMTALHWAAIKGNVELARMLMYAGASVRATTRLGAYTPLLMASRNGDAPMVAALVDGGADVNATTTSGTTPLMFAAASGSLEAVQSLLDHHADVNAREKARGETALAFAAAAGRAPVVRLLVAHGADLTVTTNVVDLKKFTKDEQTKFAAFAATGAPPNSGVRGAQPAAAKPGAPAAKPGTPAATDGRAPAAKPGAPAAKTGRGAAPAKPKGPNIGGVDRQYLYNELVGEEGGLTPLLLAARQGQAESVQALVDAGAEVNQVSAGDHTSPLLIATINGRFDVAMYLLGHGADPTLAAENGVTPLYAALNCEWAPKALYPQPRAYEQQHTTYLDLMKALLDHGAKPNVRLRKKVWYSGYNFDLSGVDETGATPFWRAAYAADIDAMKLLVAYGADPNIPTERTPGRPRTGDGQRNASDVSGRPPVPVGGPGVPPLQAAAGVGYGEGFAANSHRFAPTGMLAAVKYLVEELHADVNAQDHEGNTALHDAAARGDNEMIKYLVSKGADPKIVNREGRTTVDMANGPVQRTQPFPDTIKLLEGMGVKNNHHCVSC
ncbi:MAG TPA: ankyrin repeat domain-containing protein [Vicinamibacterales bacterium]|nr:ankyrin repeat domain-containing protein [Vicinamibacterales bacterium]